MRSTCPVLLRKAQVKFNFWKSKKDPIVVEVIIQLQPRDPIHGTQVYIRSKLTLENREETNDARRHRTNGKLKFATSIIHLRSMNQLMHIIAEPHQNTNTGIRSNEGTDSHSSINMQPKMIFNTLNITSLNLNIQQLNSCQN